MRKKNRSSKINNTLGEREKERKREREVKIFQGEELLITTCLTNFSKCSYSFFSLLGILSRHEQLSCINGHISR